MTVPPTSPDPLPPAPRGRAMPSALVAYAGIPLSGLLGVVLLAWVHERLGSPLGPGWGAELWALVKSGVVIVPAYWGLAAQVRIHNARMEASRAAPTDSGNRLPPQPYHPAERLTDGRRTPTGSLPALHPGASSRALVVVEHEEE